MTEGWASSPDNVIRVTERATVSLTVPVSVAVCAALLAGAKNTTAINMKI